MLRFSLGYLARACLKTGKQKAAGGEHLSAQALGSVPSTAQKGPAGEVS